eukprot:6726568-Pyramimonas_sp.AAC.1
MHTYAHTHIPTGMTARIWSRHAYVRARRSLPYPRVASGVCGSPHAERRGSPLGFIFSRRTNQTQEAQ